MKRLRLSSPRFRRFRKSEDGSATIEALIWLPFFLFFFMLILDATTIFMQNSKIQRIVQDANRQFIKSGFGGSTTTLETWIELALTPVAPSADAVASIDGSGVLTTSVTYSTTDTSLSGVGDFFGGLTMTVRAVHQTES